jgi:hypothetical protein
MFQQKPKSKTPPVFQQKPKSKSPPVFQQKPKSFMPGRFSSIRTPLRSLSNAERAAVYGRRSPQNKVLEQLKRAQEDCKRRGAIYNPITRQCSSRTTAQVFGGCKVDCARIGKRCGPRGKCIKL